MRMHRLPVRQSVTWASKTALLVVVLLSAGCGGGKQPETATQATGDTTTRLGSTIDISVESWLELPREKLDQKLKEYRDTVKAQQDIAMSTPAGSMFLPGLREPVQLPVVSEASFRPELGVSLPAYCQPGKPDPALALHLARYGDVEAARKVAGEGDPQLRQQLEAAGYERSYPVEWSQLVGLALHAAQLKVAAGQAEGATELAVLHKQLEAVLDAEAREGPLGSLLLSRGRRALTEAMHAWRQPSSSKVVLADDIEAALKGWGRTPTPDPLLQPGTRPDVAARILGAQPAGRLLAVVEAPAVQRALDILSLPVAREGVEGVLAFLDGTKVTEIQLVYGPGHTYPAPASVAFPLLDQGVAQAPDVGSRQELPHAAFVAGPLAYEVTLTPRSKAVGAMVRVTDQGRPLPRAFLPANPTDLGPIRLDRSFEQNRLLLAPRQAAGERVVVSRKEILDRLPVPRTSPPPATAVIERDHDLNLVHAVDLVWPEDEHLASGAFRKLLLPLWASYGPAQVEQLTGASGTYLVFFWEDSPVRYGLQVPYEDSASPVLVVEDRRGAEAVEQRLREAEAVDLAERKARWAENNPLTRMPRWLHFQQVELGMPRQDVLRVLPQAQHIRPYQLQGGTSVMFFQQAPATVTHWAQQMVLRYGPDQRVAEIRVRYLEGPGKPGPDRPALLDLLKQSGGAPEVLSAPWAALWPDLPSQKPTPVYYRWRDDRTVMTYQRDAGGAEVIIRDCTSGLPDGVSLSPLVLCPRGPAGCQVGDTREDVLARWKVTGSATTAADGALVLPMGKETGFDVLLVYFHKDRVERLIARHLEPPQMSEGSVVPALQQAWGKEIDLLGAVRRQDQARGLLLQAYGWNDDVTRVRVFGQDTQQGPRLFTEWRSWPVEAGSVTTASR